MLIVLVLSIAIALVDNGVQAKGLLIVSLQVRARVQGTRGDRLRPGARGAEVPLQLRQLAAADVLLGRAPRNRQLPVHRPPGLDAALRALQVLRRDGRARDGHFLQVR